MKSGAIIFFIFFLFRTGIAFSQTAEVNVGLQEKLGPMNIERMALGQGGVSEEPMLATNVTFLKALHPGVIRIFVPDYYDLFPKRGAYHFNTLDSMISNILQTGAQPLMCLCFKPEWLFASRNQDSVEPKDYKQWETLVYTLVKHCLGRGANVRYWEIGNEVDWGQAGGEPYRFTPENYIRYYTHTSAAILRADAHARIGGPALAFHTSPILPALLEACSKQKLPLDFVSWHTYTKDPVSVHKQVAYVKELLAKYPGLKPETIMDEWNAGLSGSDIPAFQPCFIVETIWQMKDAGLDWSCYYQIRDWYASYDYFAKDLSPTEGANQVKFFNRSPIYFGLFDFQNQIRPSYFLFKLLSRMTGEQLRVHSTGEKVHSFATYDSTLQMYNLMVWNFSDTAAVVNLNLAGIPKEMRMRQTTLDAAGPGILENQRLRPGTTVKLKERNHTESLTLEPWGIQYWSVY